MNIQKLPPFSEGWSGASMVLGPHLVKDVVPGPERGGSLAVLADGDGDGLPLQAGHHVEVYLDQSGRTIRPAGTSK